MNTLIAVLIQYRYLILFPLTVFEGPVVALVAGVLVSLGYLAFLPTYAVLILGDFIPDGVYYAIGKFGQKKNFISRYGKRFGISESRFRVIEKLWHEHSMKAMLFSKLAYGLSAPFLVTAGLAKVPYRKFFLCAAVITVINYAVMLGLGFYFGSSYVLASKYISGASIFITVFGILFFVGYFLFMHFMKKSFTKKADILGL